MITQRMGSHKPWVWTYTINTEATTAGEKQGAIPFQLYDSLGRLTVDWGDGRVDTLSAADYGDSDSSASIHTYGAPGIYQIKVQPENLQDIYFMVAQASLPAFLNNLSVFRSTLVGLNSPIPPFAGVRYYTPSRTAITQATVTEHAWQRLFNCCFYIESLPVDLFRYAEHLTSVSYIFSNVDAVSSIPERLFMPCTNLTNVTGLLQLMDNLEDFSLRFSSRNIVSASAFVSKKSGTTRIIYVPAGSTTETTFNNAASSLGLTIIGE